MGFESSAKKKAEQPKDEEIELTEKDIEIVEDIPEASKGKLLKFPEKKTEVPSPQELMERAKKRNEELAAAAPESERDKKLQKKIDELKAHQEKLVTQHGESPLGKRIKEVTEKEIDELKGKQVRHRGAQEDLKRLKQMNAERRKQRETPPSEDVESSMNELREIEKQRVEDEKPEVLKSLDELRAIEAERVKAEKEGRETTWGKAEKPRSEQEKTLDRAKQLTGKEVWIRRTSGAKQKGMLESVNGAASTGRVKFDLPENKGAVGAKDVALDDLLRWQEEGEGPSADVKEAMDELRTIEKERAAQEQHQAKSKETIAKGGSREYAGSSGESEVKAVKTPETAAKKIEVEESYLLETLGQEASERPAVIEGLKAQVAGLEKRRDDIDAALMAHEKGTKKLGWIKRWSLKRELNKIAKVLISTEDELNTQEVQHDVETGNIKRMSPEEKAKYDQGKLAAHKAARREINRGGGSGSGPMGIPGNPRM